MADPTVDDEHRPILLAVSDSGPQMTSGSTREFKALHAGIGYVTPNDEHEGRGEQIRKAREAGPERARQNRLAHHRAIRQRDQQRHPEGPHDAG